MKCLAFKHSPPPHTTTGSQQLAFPCPHRLYYISPRLMSGPQKAKWIAQTDGTTILRLASGEEQVLRVRGPGVGSKLKNTVIAVADGVNLFPELLSLQEEEALRLGKLKTKVFALSFLAVFVSVLGYYLSTPQIEKGSKDLPSFAEYQSIQQFSPLCPCSGKQVLASTFAAITVPPAVDFRLNACTAAQNLIALRAGGQKLPFTDAQAVLQIGYLQALSNMCGTLQQTLVRMGLHGGGEPGGGRVGKG